MESWLPFLCFCHMVGLFLSQGTSFLISKNNAINAWNIVLSMTETAPAVSLQQLIIAAEFALVERG